jgi:3-methyladenine DNA glycosylase/8-oxoguanine DNA glycosylase
VLVALPEPFDFALTTERFRAFGRDPANLWSDGRVLRVFRGAEASLGPAPGGVDARPRPRRGVVAEIRRFLGAPFDLVAFRGFAETTDPLLARLERGLRGLRPALVPDPFEALVGAISSQQVSLRAAFAIRARLVERLGERHARVWAFPTRERVAAASVGELRALGYSTRKAQYVLALARADVDLAALERLSDCEVKRTLTALPGLGEWTADWFLARHLGRPDAWPAGDLGLRKAVGTFYFDGRDVTVDEVRAFGERFSPHRNLAAHYLLVGHRMRRL